jgi:eukaryotic-like serine/threonine-protein kinase
MGPGTAGEPLPTVDLRTTNESPIYPTTPSHLPTVPEHDIHAELGQGGMGIVYKAWHRRLKRLVALKMIGTPNFSNSLLTRFKTEIEAAAPLKHPNIVQIYEAGEVDGRPFFSMEYLEGGNLSPHLRDKPQEGYRAAQLVQTLAEAMHYAHQNDIVHRDLKPANILLMHAPGSHGSRASETQATRDTDAPMQVTRGGSGKSGRPGGGSDTANLAFWTPKISDFGLAKHLQQESGVTRTGQGVGTPQYMSPEQARGDKDIGPATDIYSLGAILYCALTGRPPFIGKNEVETLHQVCNDEPVPPHRLRRKVEVDLETICLKCLQKSPDNRYGTAKDLAEDLGRYLRNEPILARPVNPLTRAWRWCQRNPGTAIAAALAVVFLLAGSSTSIFWGVRATANERMWRDSAAEAHTNALRAEEEKRTSNLRGYGLGMLLAQKAWNDGLTTPVRQHLFEQRPKNPVDPDLRGFECYYMEKLCHLDLRTLSGHKALLSSVAFSHDGKLIASASEDGQIKIWDTATGNEIRAISVPSKSVSSIAFSPTEYSLVSASDDKLVRLWDAMTGREIRRFSGNENRVHAVAFSPDGSQIASAGEDRTVRVWDAASARPLHSLHPASIEVFGARNVAFSPDGKHLADSDFEGRIRIWDLRSEKEIKRVEGKGVRINSIVFSPDGAMLATGQNRTVMLWDARTLIEKKTLYGHTEEVTGVAFSPDGERIVSASWDNTARIWETKTGEQKLLLRGHDLEVTAVAFSPDGRRVATGSKDRTVKIWDSTSVEEFVGLRGHVPEGHYYRRATWDTAVTRVQFSPDGRWLASAAEDHTVKIWDPSSGEEKRTLRGHDGGVRSIAVSPNGKRLASAGSDGTIKVWSTDTWEVHTTLTGHAGAVLAVAFDGAGRRLASGGADKTVRIWDAIEGKDLHVPGRHEDSVTAISFSPTGDVLASGSLDETVKIWSIETGECMETLQCQGATRGVAFSPDGARLATSSDDYLVRVWNTSDWKEMHQLRGHVCNPTSVEFSRDGKRLVSVSPCDFTVRVWDAASGQEMLILPSPSGIQHAVLSPDGLQLAGAAGDGMVKIWDARPMTAERLTLREARGIVAYWTEHRLQESELIKRIQEDITIKDAVRQCALHLAPAYWHAVVEGEAARLVQRLFARPLSRDETIKRIKEETGIWEPVRLRALALATEIAENLQAIQIASWSTAINPGYTTSQYARALAQAERLCQFKPEDPYIMQLMGMTQYRTGKYNEAIAALDRIAQMHALERVEQNDRAFITVLRYAFLAMAQHRAGQPANARVTFKLLQEAVKTRITPGQDRIAAGVVREAQSLVPGLLYHDAAHP